MCFDGDGAAFNSGLDKRSPVAACHVTPGIKGQVDGGVFIANTFEVVNNLLPAPVWIKLNRFDVAVLLVFAGQFGIDMQEVKQVGDTLFGIIFYLLAEFP